MLVAKIPNKTPKILTDPLLKKLIRNWPPIMAIIKWVCEALDTLIIAPRKRKLKIKLKGDLFKAPNNRSKEKAPIKDHHNDTLRLASFAIELMVRSMATRFTE